MSLVDLEMSRPTFDGVLYIAAMTGTQIILLLLLLLSALIGCGFAVLWLRTRDREVEARRRSEEMAILNAHLDSKSSQLEAKLAKVVGAFNTLKDHAKGKLAQASEAIVHWKGRYDRLAHWETVQNASEQAEVIRAKVRELERTAEALQNAIEGYGSRYVLPPQSVLDDLAKEAGHKEAGQRLKAARDLSRQMVRKGEAITCEEEDPERRGLIEGFVLDAFNGKVEGIMEGVKSDNIGTLMQEVNDAFLLVNRQSKIFGNAKIQKAYLKARLDELRWASLVQQYKKDEREEQKRLNEEERDKAKARRENEKERREAEQQAAEEARKKEEIDRARREGEEQARIDYERRRKVELASVAESERAAVEARLQVEHERAMRLQREEFDIRSRDQDARLQEALARTQRAKSQAELTKRGRVYIISNIGSFGENIYKIGLTRRLNYMERIEELGDASVPFGFDVHAWIESEDAPRLESELHGRFVLNQVNKMNWRKEFFRVSISEIRKVIEEMGIQVNWTMAAQAAEYRATLKLEEQMAADPVWRDRWRLEQLGIEQESLVEMEEAEQAK